MLISPGAGQSFILWLPNPLNEVLMIARTSLLTITLATILLSVHPVQSGALEPDELLSKLEWITLHTSDTVVLEYAIHKTKDLSRMLIRADNRQPFPVTMHSLIRGHFADPQQPKRDERLTFAVPSKFRQVLSEHPFFYTHLLAERLELLDLMVVRYDYTDWQLLAQFGEVKLEACWVYGMKVTPAVILQGTNTGRNEANLEVVIQTTTDKGADATFNLTLKVPKESKSAVGQWLDAAKFGKGMLTKVRALSINGKAVPEPAEPLTKSAEPVEPVKPVRVDPARPVVPGFTWLREEQFSCGGKTNRVQIYRHDAFAKILKLGRGGTDVSVEFVLIPGGEFVMGVDNPTPNPPPDRAWRTISITPFLLARTEMTQQIWDGLAPAPALRPFDFRNEFGKDFAHPRIPVHAATWVGVDSVLRKAGLRMPTDAEWEYACRAGTTTIYSFGDKASGLREYAANMFELRIYPVATKLPNAFGLFDMHGNVGEHCQDTFDSVSTVPRDGSAQIRQDNAFRVSRSGMIISWLPNTAESYNNETFNRAGVGCAHRNAIPSSGSIGLWDGVRAAATVPRSK